MPFLFLLDTATNSSWDILLVAGAILRSGNASAKSDPDVVIRYFLLCSPLPSTTTINVHFKTTIPMIYDNLQDSSYCIAADGMQC